MPVEVYELQYQVAISLERGHHTGLQNQLNVSADDRDISNHAISGDF